jgi:hypothetical protein
MLPLNRVHLGYAVIKNTKNRNKLILSFGFRRVVNVVHFLLGKSPASVCYWPTFQNTLSVPSS